MDIFSNISFYCPSKCKIRFATPCYYIFFSNLLHHTKTWKMIMENAEISDCTENSRIRPRGIRQDLSENFRDFGMCRGPSGSTERSCPSPDDPSDVSNAYQPGNPPDVINKSRRPTNIIIINTPRHRPWKSFRLNISRHSTNITPGHLLPPKPFSRHFFQKFSIKS